MNNPVPMASDCAHGMDIAGLSSFLAMHLPGDWQALSLAQFVGGQSNPTYRIRAGKADYVLRKKPSGALAPSAHAIDREFRVMQALAAAGLTVPRPHLYVNDASLLGTAFYVMPFVDGTVFKDPALPGMRCEQRQSIYNAMNDALASLHRVDPHAVGLGDFGRAGDYYARQVRRWTDQYRALAMEPSADMEALIAWLPMHLPKHESLCLVHGDFRLENLIFDSAGLRLLAILDWELSTLGDPLADLAYNMMAWYLPERAFGGFSDRDISGIGIPTEAEYLARYCAGSGRDSLPNWSFYVAFAMFRLASILFGVLRRGLDGNASSPDAIERGSMAHVCAEAACQAMGNYAGHEITV